MAVKTWRILDIGAVPENARMVLFDCQCGYEAWLPVRGRPIAVADGGVIFDNSEQGALPLTIQCRKCGRVFTNAPEAASDVR